MTQEQQQRYQELAARLLDGTITPAEREEYASWLTAAEDGEALLIPGGFAPDRRQHEKRMLQQLHRKITPVVPLYRRRFPAVAAAAAILMLLAGGYWLYIKRTETAQPIASSDRMAAPKDIAAPATNRAMVTLANGRQVYLDSAANGGLATQGQTRLVKLSDGAVAYEPIAGERLAVLQYNTLTNPRGSRPIHLTLADGTQVWLNAASSLRYPTAFAMAERRVELTGEGYFAVAKKMDAPFIVDKGRAEVQVLGTEFNINAYDDEPEMKVTLLDGLVRVRLSVDAQKPSAGVLLKPGGQAVLSAGSDRIDLQPKADTGEAVAWRNDMTAFHNADIAVILRTIRRWYDVDVEIKGALPGRTFHAEISRSATLSELLTIFAVNKIHYQLDGEKRKLTIIP